MLTEARVTEIRVNSTIRELEEQRARAETRCTQLAADLAIRDAQLEMMTEQAKELLAKVETAMTQLAALQAAADGGAPEAAVEQPEDARGSPLPATTH